MEKGYTAAGEHASQDGVVGGNANQARGSGKAHTFAKNANVWGTPVHLGHPAGQSHGGVIFVDEKTISPADLGGLVRALIELSKETGNLDWTNLVYFLQREG